MAAISVTNVKASLASGSDESGAAAGPAIDTCGVGTEVAPGSCRITMTTTECPHDHLVLVEGGYERTWTWDTDSGPVPVAIFHGTEDFSDQGDGIYTLRCTTCLATFDVDVDEWEWD